MASFIVGAMVRGIHELIRGHNLFWLRSAETSKIKHFENRVLYGNMIYIL